MKRYPPFEPPEYVDWTPDEEVMDAYEGRFEKEPALRESLEELGAEGFAWEAPDLLVRSGGEALDKPWLAHDPDRDVLYLTYTNWSQNRGELTWSTDRGRTWSAPLVVFDSSRSSGYTVAVGADVVGGGCDHLKLGLIGLG